MTALKSEPLGEYDTIVHVPEHAPDPADSVVVLEIKGHIKTHSGRLLEPRIANRLLAFDAETHGKGFKYGDGKAANYYVAGFNRASDTLGWKARLNEPAAFDVSVKYRAASDQTGSYQLKIGDQTLDGEVRPTRGTKTIGTANLGTVKLTAGEFDIVFQPTKIAGGELMQLFEVDLTPAK
jgi:hypothetical protein